MKNRKQFCMYSTLTQGIPVLFSAFSNFRTRCCCCCCFFEGGEIGREIISVKTCPELTIPLFSYQPHLFFFFLFFFSYISPLCHSFTLPNKFTKQTKPKTFLKKTLFICVRKSLMILLKVSRHVHKARVCRKLIQLLRTALPIDQGIIFS